MILRINCNKNILLKVNLSYLDRMNKVKLFQLSLITEEKISISNILVV